MREVESFDSRGTRANPLWDKEKGTEEMSRGSHNYAWIAKKMKPHGENGLGEHAPAIQRYQHERDGVSCHYWRGRGGRFGCGVQCARGAFSATVDHRCCVHRQDGALRNGEFALPGRLGGAFRRTG